MFVVGVCRRVMSDSDTEEQQNFALGLAAVTLAVLSFGSFAVPLRNKDFVEANVHPIVLQSYFTASIFLTSFISLGFVEWQFNWWGWLGAGLWLTASLMSFVAIAHIGIAVPQAVWSGVTIIVSFMWGSIFFKENVTSLPLAVVALFFLCLGVTGCSLCSMQIEVYLPSFLRCLYCLPIFQRIGDLNINQIISSDEDDTVHSTSSSASPSRLTWFIGLTASVLVGIPNGSMMIPTRIDGVPGGLAYLMSFSTGVFVFTAFILLSFVIFTFIVKREAVKFHLRAALIPGLLAGLLWSIGNFASIYAVKYLGLTIGFPLTQMALVVSGLWGIFFYREVNRRSAIVMFFVSAAIILLGAALLSLYG